MTQTSLDDAVTQVTTTPAQNNYLRLVKGHEDILNELTWLRHEWEDNKRDLFDLNELVGRLASKIEEWVGVAEE